MTAAGTKQDRATNPSDASPFGKCPRCGGNEGFFNLGPDHWFICTKHELRWFAGTNLFRCWRDELPEDWEENLQLYGQFRIVE